MDSVCLSGRFCRIRPKYLPLGSAVYLFLGLLGGKMSKTFESWTIMNGAKPYCITGYNATYAWKSLRAYFESTADLYSFIEECKHLGYRAVRCKIIIEDDNDNREKDD